MPASISLTLRYMIMGIILMSLVFTVQSQATSVRKSLHHKKMGEISRYISRSIFHGMKSVNEYNTTTNITLHLPELQRGYVVKAKCVNDNLIVNTTSTYQKTSYPIRENIKCGWVNVTGKVFSGEKCLTLNRKNSTMINIKLVNDCGA